MASLGLSGDEAAKFLAELGEEAAQIAVAALNGPYSTVVSGPPGQMKAVLAACETAGHRGRLIDVDYASHGPQVDRLADVIGAELAGIVPRGTDVAYYSAVTGCREDAGKLDAGYWFTSLRQQVRFAPAIDALLADGYRVFVEASPHPVLTLALRECFEEAGVTAVTVPTLRRDDGGRARLAASLGEAFAGGLAVDWTRWFADLPQPRRVALPTYPFQRKRYWLATGDGRRSQDAPGGRSLGHPLLSSAVALADGGLVLNGRVPGGDEADWLGGHTVAGVPLVPGAVLVEWALRAADEAGAASLEELVLRVPLVLPGPEGAETQLVVGTADADGRRELRIFSRPTGAVDGWTCHATGLLGPGQAETEDAGAAGQWPPSGARSVDLTGVYERAEEQGYGYGPHFRNVRALWRDGRDLLAEVALPEGFTADAGGFDIHPLLLDAALQPLLLTGAAEPQEAAEPAEQQVWLPFGWNGVTLLAAGADRVRVRLSPQEQDAEDERTLRITVADVAGTPVLTAESVVLRPQTAGQLPAARPAQDLPAVPGGRAPVRAVAASAVRSVDWAGKLAGLAPAEQRRLVLDLVRGHAATVLGRDDAGALRVDVPFKDLGFDSLTAVELRDRLVAATGLRLPAAVVFRHPTLEALARRVEDGLVPGDAGDGGAAADPLLADLARLEGALDGGAPADADLEAVAARLEGVLARWKASAAPAARTPEAADKLQSATANEILDFIEQRARRALRRAPRPPR